MRGRGGYSLLEFLACILLVAFLINVLAVLTMRFHESYQRVEGAFDDLELADRFLADVKADLRSCHAVEVKEKTLKLKTREAEWISYEFNSDDGSVFRSGDGPERAYLYGFSSVTFEREEGEVVSVALELRKQDPLSPVQPEMGAVVFCRNVRGSR